VSDPDCLSSRDIADRAVNLFVDGETDVLRRTFNHSMKVAASAEKVDDVRRRALRAFGPFTHRREPVAKTARGGDVYDYPLEHERGSHHLQIVIREGAVAGMLLRTGHPTGRWRRSKGSVRELVRGRRRTR